MEAEERHINLPEDDPEMIRRLIAYLYLGDYEPCNEVSIAQFKNFKQPESTTLDAPAYYSRYRKGGIHEAFETSDQCACLTSNTKNATQPLLSGPKVKPKDYAIVAKSAKGFEVANPLTIHATMYALADKYQVDGLGQLARQKFESCLHHHANSEDFVAAIQIA